MTRKKPRTPGWHLSLCSVIPSGARSIIVLLLAFGWSNVGPRAQFSNHVTHVGLGPMSHAVGDFDRDGQDDLVTANRDSSDLSVVLGNGNGTFGPETRYPLGGSPGFLVLEDFDGDGFDDVVVTIPSIDGISVLLGLGDGRFTEPSRYPAGEAPFGIAVADFDRDGDQDLVVTSDDTDQVSLLYGRGDGTFDLGPTYGAGDGPRGVVVADFNQDGVPDAAVANYWSEDVSVLLGTTDGGLGPETRYALVDNPHAIAVVDVDEDGIQDVAASDNQEVSVLIGAGDGTFGRAITVTEQRDVLLALAACDLDQDGHADLVGAGYNASVFRGNGDGTFQDEETTRLDDEFYGVSCADLDADGREDLIAVGSGVRVLLNDGEGRLIGDLPLYLGRDSTSVVTADFDEDGHADAAFSYGHHRVMTVHLWDGSPSFRLAAEIEAWSALIGTADLNTDGHQDVFTRSLVSPSSFSIHLGQGDGTFSWVTDADVTPYPAGHAVGDLDRDGNPDLVVTDGFEQTLTILIGNGDGTFESPTSIDAPEGPVAVAVEDLDGDGLLDLAVADAVTDHVSVWVGRGDGSFRDRVLFRVGTTPYAIAAADLDHDGNQDLVTANIRSNDLSVLLGHGDATFEMDRRVRVYSLPRDVVIDDFDLDGHPDLVSVSPAAGGDLSVLAGLGDGTFRPYVLFDVPDGSRSLAVADFDADGAPDLVTAGDSGSVSVLMNQTAIPNHPPQANAGADVDLECTSFVGAIARLDGSSSTDPDSSPGTNDDIVLFEWFEDFGLPGQQPLGDAERVEVTLPLGVHRLTLRVTDGLGQTSIDGVVVRVLDTTAPALVVVAEPDHLWPPNRQWVDVTVSAIARDACGDPSVALISAWNNEDDTIVDSSGEHTVDWLQGADVGAEDFEFRLKAERDGQGTGRVYTVVYTATDRSGNQSNAEVRVSVPHDLSRPRWER